MKNPFNGGARQAQTVTSEAEVLAERIRKRVFELELDSAPDAEMKCWTLEDIGGRLAAGEIDYAAAQEALAGLKDYFDHPPEPEPEVQTAATVKAPIAFPLDTLLGHYHAYTERVTTSTQTDLDANGAATLGGISALVGPRIKVRISESWCYHSGLYICISAPASYGKGGILESVEQPIRSYEALIRADSENTRHQYRAQAVMLSAEVDDLKRQLSTALKGGDRDDKDHVAPDISKAISEKQTELERLKALSEEPQLIQDDFTFETTGELMKLNKNRMSVISADTEIFNTQRYSTNPPMGILLKSWKGESHREDRKRGELKVDLGDPSMAMLVVTQTENIKALCQANQALVYRGFMPRFLFVLPDSNIGGRDRRAAILGGGIPHHVQSGFNEPLIELAQYLDGIDGGILELQMPPEALEVYADCCQDIEHRRAPGGDLQGLSEVAGKADLQLEKLIGINWAMHSTVSGDRSPLVTLGMVKAAYQQLNFFLDQQGRLYDQLSKAPVEDLRDKIERWCLENPDVLVDRRELHRTLARGKSIKLLKEALEALAKDGVVQLITVRDTGGAPRHRVAVI